MKKIKMTENSWCMSRLYKRGYQYEVPEDEFELLKNKCQIVESTIDYEALNKKELQSILDKKGIEYANKMTKNELLELLGGE